MRPLRHAGRWCSAAASPTPALRPSRRRWVSAPGSASSRWARSADRRRGQPPDAPTAPMLAAGVRPCSGAGPGATRWCAAACHAVRGRSLRSLRPSRHARCWCFSEVAGVRSSIRWSVLALVAALPALRPPLFVTPLAGVSPEQPSRRPEAGRHAACGGLTFPPYRSLRSLGGNGPGSRPNAVRGRGPAPAPSA
jgi:hypothetical protein